MLVSARSFWQRERHRLTCRFYVGLDDGTDFGVCKRLIGPKGVNMKSIIAAVPDAKVRTQSIRG